MIIAVSKCLLGYNTRYDGKIKTNQELLELLKNHTIIPVCPEVSGGLSVPRAPSERQGTKVINNQGEDVTINYEIGSNKELENIINNHCDIVILKSKSPACGKDLIHNGLFDGGLVEGNGTLTQRLLEKKIKIYSELETKELKGILK